MLGSGTELDPYQITTKDEFLLMANRSYRSGYFKMMNDIDLAENGNWSPLTFLGTLDGNGKTVTNSFNYLSQFDNVAKNIGIFSLVGGTVRNLRLSNIRVYRRGVEGLGLLASTISNGLVENVHIDDTCSLVASYASTFTVNYGAISSSISSNSIVRNCLIESDVRGIRVVGAVAGTLLSGSRIENCLYYTNVYSDLVKASDGGKIGGIVGNISADSSVVNSYGSSTKDRESNDNSAPRLSDAQLANESSFVGWDFENTWIMVEDSRGVTYPVLRTFLPPPVEEVFVELRKVGSYTEKLQSMTVMKKVATLKSTSNLFNLVSIWSTFVLIDSIRLLRPSNVTVVFSKCDLNLNSRSFDSFCVLANSHTNRTAKIPCVTTISIGNSNI